MKKILPVAFLAIMMGASAANANVMLQREGFQNYYYYFGAPCPSSMKAAAPCGETTMCAAPTPCCCPGGYAGLLGLGGVFGIL